jgi:undecaprenyl-diphosphatase
MNAAADTQASAVDTLDPVVAPLSRLARLVAFDDRLLRRLVKTRRARSTFALRVLCRMYDPDMVVLAIAIGLFSPTLTPYANRAGLAMIITSLLVVVIKRLVRRARPALDIQASIPPDKFSFPSGHTAAAFAVAVAMSGTMPILVPPLFVVAFVVAYGRMYLGVHYPLDVGCGAAIGLVTGSIAALL